MQDSNAKPTPEALPDATAAGRGVIHRPMLVGREITDLDRRARPGAFLQRAPGNRDAKRAGEHLWVERQDLDLEGHRSSVRIRRSTARFPAK